MPSNLRTIILSCHSYQFLGTSQNLSRAHFPPLSLAKTLGLGLYMCVISVFINTSTHKTEIKAVRILMNIGASSEETPMNQRSSQGRKKEPCREAWTAEEDKKLVQIVHLHGPKRWKFIAARAGIYMYLHIHTHSKN